MNFARSASLVATCFLVGCGGGGKPTIPVLGQAVTGEVIIDTKLGSSINNLYQSDKPWIAMMDIEGVSTPVVIPGSQQIDGGTIVRLTTREFPFRITPVSLPQIPTRGVDTPGEILVGGKDTGLRVFDGQIVGCPGPSYIYLTGSIHVVGPIVLGDAEGAHLTLSEGIDILSSYPTECHYSLPSDGGKVDGSFVSMTTPTTGFPPPFRHWAVGWSIDWPLGTLAGAGLLDIPTPTPSLLSLRIPMASATAAQVPKDGVTTLGFWANVKI